MLPLEFKSKQNRNKIKNVLKQMYPKIHIFNNENIFKVFGLNS